MSQLADILHFRLTEQPIYGSARLGVPNLERTEVYACYLIDKKQLTAEPEDPTQPLLVLPQNPKGDISTPLTPQPEYSLTLGNKQYELSNHLGNVQVTLSDKKLGQAPPESSSFTHYLADVRSAVDYYPFGMQMPGRSVDGGYRWGFNGMEEEKCFHNDALFIDYGARVYNPKIAKWASVEPLFHKYPSLTPFAFSANSPIFAKDFDGKDIIILSAPQSVGGLGHAAILIGNDKDGWTLYSKNGTYGSLSGLGSAGPSNKNPQNGLFVGSLDNFALNYNLNYKGDVEYTSAFKITTSKEQDEKMKEVANEQISNWYSLNIFNKSKNGSCIDVCSDALASIGLNPGLEDSFNWKTGQITKDALEPSPVPNMRYNEIKKDNNGQDVTPKIIPKEKEVKLRKESYKNRLRARDRQMLRSSEGSNGSKADNTSVIKN